MANNWEILENSGYYGVIILAFIAWLRWRRKRTSIFKELGIPGPTPSIFFGNILELHRKGVLECQEEWIRKYGKVVGYYHGMKPILLVTDLDLLKTIFIKNFHSFSDRPDSVPLRVKTFIDHIIPASSIMDSVLTNLKGERWKEVRSVMSVAFSAKQLKMMIPAVDKVVDVAVSVLQKKSEIGESFDIYQVLQRLTLDIICAQAFALDTNIQTNENDPLFRSAKTIFCLTYRSKLVFLGTCFPEIGFVAMALNFLKMFLTNNFSIPPLKITELVRDVIEKRRRDPSMRRPDLLQLLTESSAENIDHNADSSEYANESIKKSSKILNQRDKRTLSDLEVQSNALIVFLAGYETISSALAYSFYFLGKYPEYQRKIQEEIDQNFKKDVLPNYHSMNSFQQIENFLLETMRLYPPAINFVQRVAVDDIDFGEIRIPKGLEILVPTKHMHYNPEYWENPDVFNPDRFSLKNRSNYTVTYWAFGSGPRYCIGTRLVYLTTKIILAKVLQRFTIELANPEQESVPSIIKCSTMCPDEVLVKVLPRSS